jgi:hypothetical protein
MDSLSLLSLGFGLSSPLVTYFYFALMGRPKKIKRASHPQDYGQPALPQKVSPALAGLFGDGKVGEAEIAATIIDLLHKGYLGVLDKNDKIVLVKQKRLDRLPKFERTIAEHLLSRGTVAKSELEIEHKINRQLYDPHVSEALRLLYEQAVQEKFFLADPNRLYAWYYLVGLLVFFGGVILLVFLLPSFADRSFLLFYPLGLILSGTTIIFKARDLPLVAAYGYRLMESWLNFREELVHFTPTRESPDNYLRYLPYAFALGVEQEWTEAWKDEVFGQPDWFTTFETPTRKEFLGKLSGVVKALSRDLFALRDPALKD